MAVAFTGNHGYGTTTSSGGGFTINLPAYSPGHLIIVAVRSDESTGYAFGGIPSGWTELSTSTIYPQSGGLLGASVMYIYRIMQSGDGSTLTFTYSLNGVGMKFITSVWSGVDADDPIDVASPHIYENSPTVSANALGSIVTKTPNAMVVAFNWLRDTAVGGATSLTPPTGFTEGLDWLITTNDIAGFAYKTQASAGTTGDLTYTSDRTGGTSAGVSNRALFALRESGQSVSSAVLVSRADSTFGWSATTYKLDTGTWSTVGSASSLPRHNLNNPRRSGLVSGALASGQDPGANGSQTISVKLSPTPSDFSSMSAMTIRYSTTLASTTYTDDTASLDVWVTNAANTVNLAPAGGLGSAMILHWFDGSTWNSGSTTPGYNLTTAFTDVNTSATKADWDGALVHFKFTDNRNMGSDNATIALIGAQFEVTYTTASTDHSETVTENLGLTDDPVVTSVSQHNLTFTDGLGITDTVAPAHVAYYTVVDVSGILDAHAEELYSQLTEAATDTLGGTDPPPTVTLGINLTFTDALGSVDTTELRRVLEWSGSAYYLPTDDPLGLTDTPEVSIGHGVTAADTAGLTDTATVSRNLSLVFTESIGLTETTALASAASLAFTDTLGGLDTADVVVEAGGANLTETATDPIGATDTATVAVAYDIEAGAANYRSVVLADSPDVYWALDEASGTVADLSGNGWSGTTSGVVYGEPSILPNEPSSTAMGFINGANLVPGSEVASASSPPPFTVVTTFTMEAWIKTDLPTTAGQTIMSMGNGDGAEGYALEYMSESHGAGQVNVLYHGVVRTTLGTISDTNLHHVVLTRDNADGIARLYIDGSLSNSAAVGASPDLAATQVFTVGRDRSSARSNRGFDGNIVHAAFYDTVLDSTRVTAHYNAGLSTLGAETVGITDTAEVAGVLTLAPVETLGATDTVAVAQTIDLVFTEALGATDTAAPSNAQPITVTDALGGTDSSTQELLRTLDTTVTDTLGATDSTTLSRTMALVITDGLGSTDSASAAKVIEIGTALPTPEDLSAETWGTISGQSNGTTNVLDAYTVELVGNQWAVTQGTTDRWVINPGDVVSMDVKVSADGGEVQGFAFQDQSTAIPTQFDIPGTETSWQFGGSTTGWAWNAHTEDAYVPGYDTGAFDTWQTLVFPVGDYAPGSYHFLCLIADDDADTPPDIAFRNIRIYNPNEQGPGVVDSLGATDSTTFATQAALALTESIGLVDVYTADESAGLDQTVTDLQDLNDVVEITEVKVHQITVTDALGATDSSTVAKAIAVAPIIDGLGATDSTTSASALAVSRTDALGATDTALPSASLFEVATDTAGLTDTETALHAQVRTEVVVDAIGATDTTTDLLGTALTFTETIGVADSTETQEDTFRSFVDTVGVLDPVVITEANDGALTQVEPLALTDTVAQALQSPRTYTDTADISDSATPEISTDRTVVESVGVSDTVEVELVSITEITDSVGATDDAVASAAQSVIQAEALGLLDTEETSKAIVFALLDTVGGSDYAERSVGIALVTTDILGAVDLAVSYLPLGTGFFYMNDVSKLYVGAKPVKYLYWGGQLVWTAPLPE